MKQLSAKDIRLGKEFSETLLKTIPFGIDIVDDKGNILFINDALKNLIEKEGLGRKCWAMYKDNKKQCPGCPLRKGIKVGKTATLEVKGVLGGRVYRIHHTGMNYQGKKAVLEVFKNITESYKMEAQLRFAKFSVDKGADPIFWMGKDAKFVHVNEAACKALGYSEKELLNMTVHNIDPNFSKKVWPAHWKALKKKKHMIITSKHRRKDGTEMDVELSLNYHMFEGKEYNFAFARDITERKKAEEELKESEKKFRGLFNVSPELVVLIDTKKVIIDVNDKGEEWLGYKRSEVVGKNFLQLDFITKESKAKMLKANIKRMMGVNIPPYDVEFVRKDGRSMLTRLKASLILDEQGKKKGVVAIFSDVTEQRKAHEELVLSEKKYREIFENMRNGWAYHRIITNKKGKPVDYEFLEINNAFTRLTGLTRKKVIGKKVTEALPGIRADPADWIGRYGEVALKEKDIAFEDYSEALGKWFAVSAFSPRKGYFVAVFDDITKRKKYEDALRVSEEKYRQLYESSRDAIMTLKPPTWRFTAGNPAAVRMFGCKNESQFVALTPYEFSPKYQPDGKTSNQKAIEMINKAMKEGSNFFEWTHRTLKGEDFYATVLLTRIELKNGMQSLQATVRNITTQKLAQEKVRQLALFLDENPDPVLRVDRSNTIVYANDASKGLLKMLKCAIGKKVPKFCNPMIKKAFKTREKKTTEVQVEDNIFQLIIIPLPDKDFVYLYVQDITEQKFAEEKLQKAYESLKKKTEELERFSKFTVGRELRMIELKKKLRER